MVVVASTYGGKTGEARLLHAEAERDMLSADLPNYGVEVDKYEATTADMDKLVVQAKASGCGIHFAVHGYSDPVADDQYLILADKGGRRLSPTGLLGARMPGEPARYDFAFMNACQVGTPGTMLGLASGFPAAFLADGAKGFVAPLWNVKDSFAGKMAADFYRDVLMNGTSSVANFFAERRYNYSCETDTTCPWAYIFYGHPRLILRNPKSTAITV
jgi:CHAT domain-containing protein